MKLRCVFFDLDGTLLDTAPDLINSLNSALLRQGLPEISLEQIKPYISFGAAMMVRQSLADLYNAELKEKVLHTMLDDYQHHLADQTELFPGMQSLLLILENRGITWGVVTNKKKRYTEPLMQALNLTSRTACIISGDSTANSKPHPEPLLMACKLAGVAAEQCLYIGDSSNDIVAGKNAGMKTLAAAYGYLKPEDNPGHWQADALIQHPVEILEWINKNQCH